MRQNIICLSQRLVSNYQKLYYSYGYGLGLFIKERNDDYKIIKGKGAVCRAEGRRC